MSPPAVSSARSRKPAPFFDRSSQSGPQPVVETRRGVPHESAPSVDKTNALPTRTLESMPDVESGTSVKVWKPKNTFAPLTTSDGLWADCCRPLESAATAGNVCHDYVCPLSSERPSLIEPRELPAPGLVT